MVQSIQPIYGEDLESTPQERFHAWYYKLGQNHVIGSDIDPRREPNAIVSAGGHSIILFLSHHLIFID